MQNQQYCSRCGGHSKIVCSINMNCCAQSKFHLDCIVGCNKCPNCKKEYAKPIVAAIEHVYFDGIKQQTMQTKEAEYKRKKARIQMQRVIAETIVPFFMQTQNKKETKKFN